MKEIKCPKCGEIFQIDESGYAEILKAVRNDEFESELKERERHLSSEMKHSIEKIETEKKNAIEKLTFEKKTEIEKIKLENETEIEGLKKELKALKENNEREIKLSVADKEQQILKLKGEINEKKSQYELEKSNSLKEKDEEISRLLTELNKNKYEAELREKALNESHQRELKMKDETIEYYKDLKSHQSTKMVGETLEQHCENEFNKLRAMGFSSAYFEKDNDAKTGSKGDYIFKDFSEDGVEYISIMFEMKNQMETTATKKKNEDFFKELDKDRREKGCEYAVLVSMLESDNELYNAGIVDVSYRYPKMYVVRPQFFIPIITLLRNAAKNSIEYKRELIIAKNQSIDITNFENEMISFQKGFEKNFNDASNRFKDAIDEINKSIEHLQKIKDALTLSDKHLRLANDKAQDLSIKKLTKNSPSVRAQFEELKNVNK